MSKNIFADPKMALGFAGVTVAFALVASMGAGAFLPASNQEAAPNGPVESAPVAAQPKPAQPAASWADDGLSEDWNSNGFGSNEDDGWANSPRSSSSAPEIEDYVPQRFTGSEPSSRRSGAQRAAPAQRSVNDDPEVGGIPAPGERGRNVPPQPLPIR